MTNTWRLSISDTLITDLSGLAALKITVEGLAIFANPNLTSLAGLESLESLEYLGVFDNPKRTSVAALTQGDLTTVAYYLQITGNPMLLTCNAMAVEDALAAPPEYACFHDNKLDPCAVGDICEAPPRP